MRCTWNSPNPITSRATARSVSPPAQSLGLPHNPCLRCHPMVSSRPIAPAGGVQPLRREVAAGLLGFASQPVSGHRLPTTHLVPCSPALRAPVTERQSDEYSQAADPTHLHPCSTSPHGAPDFWVAFCGGVHRKTRPASPPSPPACPLPADGAVCGRPASLPPVLASDVSRFDIYWRRLEGTGAATRSQPGA